MFTIQADRKAISMSNLTLADFCPEIPSLGSQNELFYNTCLRSSQSLVQAIHAINLVLNNEQCSNAAVPFFCNATFLLCGDDSFDVSSFNMDLKKECLQVRDNDCTIEWRILENIFNVPIPSCESFAVNKNLTFSKAPALTCPDQFNVFCDSVCLPSCEDFSQYSDDATLASYVLVFVFQLIGLISGVITLIACLFNRKKM